MNHASLFTGIGGFDLAAEWMGWENVFQVEIDPFCQKVLAKNFPNVKRYGDIKQFDGMPYRGSIDVLSGGFPCQPFSSSGKRKGVKDARHLWPENDRIIGEIQPPVIVGENVRGLLNWNKGMVFDQIQTDLENKGYQVAPFLLPACGLDAWHRRDRIWIIAYNPNFRRWRYPENDGNRVQRKEFAFGETDSSNLQEAHTNANTSGLSVGIQRGVRSAPGEPGALSGSKSTRIHSAPYWGKFPNQSPICRRDDGIPNRVDRIKSLGNAIVPQIAYEIFKAIEIIQGSAKLT